MYCIQQVGLAGTVLTANAGDPFSKINRTIIVVFELEQRYGLKVKH